MMRGVDVILGSFIALCLWALSEAFWISNRPEEVVLQENDLLRFLSFNDAVEMGPMMNDQDLISRRQVRSAYGPRKLTQVAHDFGHSVFLLNSMMRKEHKDNQKRNMIAVLRRRMEAVG